MTLDQLKAEAEKQGYKLVKKPDPLPRIHPCSCGRQKLQTWWEAGEYQGRGTFLKCPNCGKRGAVGKTERETRENWNALFEVEK